MKKIYGVTLLLSLCTGLQAVPITGLINTGRNSTNTSAQQSSDAGPNGPAELYYQANGGQGTLFTVNVECLCTAYLPNTSGSNWISLDVNGGRGFSSGTYTLDVTLPTNLISGSTLGRWASDDCATALLNGNQFATIGGGTSNCVPSGTNFNTWHPFSTNSFVAGLNTFTFNIANGGGPQAVRVEFFESDMTLTDTPEPGTFALLGLGLAGVGVAHRRRRSRR